MRLRISLTLVTLLAAITALTIGLGSAAAQDEVAPLPDPQTTNIPYVAWNGEQVKITKCFDRGHSEALRQVSFSDVGKFVIENWTGEASQKPEFLNDNSGNIIAENRGDFVCWSIHVSSTLPGMAIIKLAARKDILGLFPGNDPWLKHQFLVIWLNSQPATIVEVPTPGDPAGDGHFVPVPGAGPGGTNAFLPGLVKLNVKGTFPLGGAFAGNDFSGTTTKTSTITLPDDWAWLANHLAVDDTLTGSNYPGIAAARWDIHDDQSKTEGHTAASMCIGPLAALIDAVDNCLGGGQDGRFSRTVDGTTAPTIGPFDPLFPDNTLLTDGSLNKDDTPMPALRLDVTLAPGSVGSLSKADKADIYIRDATLSPEAAHNLYAPFYSAYIPATAREGGSGVAGSFANNFTGFINDGVYDYWNVFSTSARRGFNACNDVLGNPVPTPTGNDGVAVYTDEHGEAYVQFNPSVGMFLTPDSNGRCDFYKPGLLGTATIQARSIYPDQPVLWDQSNKLSNTLAKRVDHLASKTLSCVPKGPNEAFCVEKITDIQGNPVADATVEFTTDASNGSSSKLAADGTALVPGFNTFGQEIIVDTPGLVRVDTNSLGQAGVSVHNSTVACVNVSAENIGTRNGGAGIFRDTDFNPKAGAVCTQTGTTGGTGGTTTTTPTTTGPSAQGGGGAVVTAAPVAISAPVPTARATAPAVAPAKVAKVQLVSAIVVKSKAGRYLQVRVNSASKVAKLRITLIGKDGKVTRVVLRSVSTNHTVRVPNLKLAPSVRTVRVALA